MTRVATAVVGDDVTGAGFTAYQPIAIGRLIKLELIAANLTDCARSRGNPSFVGSVLRVTCVFTERWFSVLLTTHRIGAVVYGLNASLP